MRIADVLNLPSMPPASPSYPRGPFRFIDREYFIIRYESDPAAIRDAVPEPLEPDGSNEVFYEFIRMPDSAGFGDYYESGTVIPAKFRGKSVNYVAQMYLDNDPPIVGGREIWGFPKKYASPSLKVAHDTLTGVLEYAGREVAIGTMVYKHTNVLQDRTGVSVSPENVLAGIRKPSVNLKLIPDVDGTLAIAQLVSYVLIEITLKWAWSGPARLHLIPHVNAPVADLPVLKVCEGLHLLADLTLPYGERMFDYKEPKLA